MSKFAIDLGHGVSYDTGAVSRYIKEETIINSVGPLVINKLRSLGHSVIEVRPSYASSVGNSLYQRYTKANSNNIDLFVSIHANAGGGKGVEIFTYNGGEVKSARNIINNISALGFVNRGIKNGSNLSVIKNTKAVAMLIEVCFIDTKSDVDLYNSLGSEKIADAIVQGLVGTTIASNNSNKINTSTSKPNNINNTPSVSELQSELNKQFNAGLVVDNIAGPKTLSACIVVSYNAAGNITKWIQKKLNSLGYNCGQADGIFGNNTLAGVKEFQKAKGLAVDGIIGKNTWRKLLGL